MPQTKVKSQTFVGYPGTPATPSGSGVIRAALKSYYNKTGAKIAFGKPVVLVDNETNLIELPSDNIKKPEGIIIHNELRNGSFSIYQDNDFVTQGVPHNKQASIYTGGLTDYWVKVENGLTITPGEAVHYRHAIVTTEELGDFSNVTGDANLVLWEDVFFVTPSYTLDEISVAAINLGTNRKL